MVVKYGCMLNVIKFRAISSRSVDQATNNSHFQFLKIYCTPLLIIFTLSLPPFFFLQRIWEALIITAHLAKQNLILNCQIQKRDSQESSKYMEPRFN